MVTQQDRECQNQAVLWPSVGLSSQQEGSHWSKTHLSWPQPVSCIPGLLPQPRAGRMGMHGTARA